MSSACISELLTEKVNVILIYTLPLLGDFKLQIDSSLLIVEPSFFHVKVLALRFDRVLDLSVLSMDACLLVTFVFTRFVETDRAGSFTAC